MRISSPPFLHPCYYGTDIDSEEHLIACRFTTEETAAIIGADSLGYLPEPKLFTLTGNHRYCSACFSGRYPTAVPAGTKKDRFEQKFSETRPAGDGENPVAAYGRFGGKASETNK